MSKTGHIKLDYPFEARPEEGRVTEIVPGVLWVALPLPIPGLDWINVWLIADGDGWTLVDTGISTDQIREIWEGIFDTYLDGKPIKRVIATHLHPDHVGLAGWVTEKFDCDLWMTQSEYFACRMLVSDTGRDAPAAGVDFYRRAGWSENALKRYKERFGFFGYMVYQLPDSYRRMQDDQVIQIGDYDWRVIVGTGHCPEHACLFCEELNILISGDQILPKISSNISVYPTEPEADPLSDWLDSCAMLKTKVPKDVLTLPAHNLPFYGAHERLDSLIKGHHKQLDRLEKRLEEPAKAVDVFTTLFFRKIDSSDLFSATGEAIAHLNYLRFRGRASRKLVDGVYEYSAKT